MNTQVSIIQSTTVDTLNQDEGVSTRSPQSGTQWRQWDAFRRFAFSENCAFMALISFLPVCLCTCVLIAFYAMLSPKCHTEIVPEGYNNQTETWTERQEIEVCEDRTFDKAILPGVLLFIGSLFVFVVLSNICGSFAVCCGVDYETYLEKCYAWLMTNCNSN